MSAAKSLDVFKFIEAVRKERFLYDKNNDDYRNADKRQQIWNDIAERFGFSDGKDAYKKWKYFKDHFFAEKRKMSQRGVSESENTDYKKWQYYDALKWTENFLDRRKSRSSTDDQMEDVSPTPTPTMVFEDRIPAQMKLENCVSLLNNAFDHNLHQIHPVLQQQQLNEPQPQLNPHQQQQLNDSRKQQQQQQMSEKESEMDSMLLFRPFESVFAAAATANIHNLGAVGDTNGIGTADNVVNGNGGSSTKTTAAGAGCGSSSNSKQQQQLLHQTLVAESEEELFGRLVARDLVRLPANLRPLARLKIQELLYHFSIGHVPELH